MLLTIFYIIGMLFTAVLAIKEVKEVGITAAMLMGAIWPVVWAIGLIAMLVERAHKRK